MFMWLKDLSKVALEKAVHKYNSTIGEMSFHWGLFFPMIGNFDHSSNRFWSMIQK